jgi:hypothetical protein
MAGNICSCFCRWGGGDHHVREPVHGHGVARHPVKRRQPASRAHGVRVASRRVARGADPIRLVGPHVGARDAPSRRVGSSAQRVTAAPAPPRRRRWPSSRSTAAVDWLQPAGAGGSFVQRQRRSGVVRGGLKRDVPRGAPRPRRRGVPQRVRCVRAA